MLWFLKAVRTGAGQHQAGGLGGIVSGEAAGCHHQQGLASCPSTHRESLGTSPLWCGTPCSRIFRTFGVCSPELPLHLQSSPSLLPGSVTVGWGWFGDGKRASTPKCSCHDYSRQSSFEPWRTCRVLQPSKTAQARLADLHASHDPKLSEPHVCSGNKVCFLNCSHSWI